MYDWVTLLFTVSLYTTATFVFCQPRYNVANLLIGLHNDRRREALVHYGEGVRLHPAIHQRKALPALAAMWEEWDQPRVEVISVTRLRESGEEEKKEGEGSLAKVTVHVHGDVGGGRMCAFVAGAGRLGSDVGDNSNESQPPLHCSAPVTSAGQVVLLSFPFKESLESMRVAVIVSARYGGRRDKQRSVIRPDVKGGGAAKTEGTYNVTLCETVVSAAMIILK